MPTLPQEIATQFLANLSTTGKVDATTIEHLRVILADGKKIKAEDLVRIFSRPVGGDIK